MFPGWMLQAIWSGPIAPVFARLGPGFFLLQLWTAVWPPQPRMAARDSEG
jgi:hypothetical protein